jgi:uncharacterized protein with HEPN domain
MPHDDDATLLDIAHCCRRIVALLASREFHDFQSDEALREAVQYRLIVMGEAVKRLSDEFRVAHSGFRWSGVAGLRDILVHAYERVDHRELWNIATVSVPQLLTFIEPSLPGRSDEDGPDSGC